MSAANGYSHDNVVKKLVSLKERVTHSSLPNTDDLIWCKRMIADAIGSGVIPNKYEFTRANRIWEKHCNVI